MLRMRSTKLAPLSEVCEKKLPGRHVARVAPRGPRELAVEPQRAQVVAGALRVQQAERGPHQGPLAGAARRRVRGTGRPAPRRRRHGDESSTASGCQRRAADCWKSACTTSVGPRERPLGGRMTAPWTSVRPRFGDMGRVRVRRMPPAAILDVDGTLVDTNYHHAIAWYRAFRQHERRAADLAHPPPHRDGRRPARRGALRRARSRGAGRRHPRRGEGALHGADRRGRAARRARAS